MAKKPITRAKVKSIDDKYYGPEPLDISNKGIGEALNWYNYMFEHDQAREWLLEYMRKSGKYTKTQIAEARRCPKHAVPTTIGWHSRMMMNGNELPEQSMKFFNERLNNVVELGKQTKEKVEENTTVKPIISIKERTQAKNDILFAEAEAEVIDERGSMYSFLQKHQATPNAAAYLRSKYIKELDEIMSDDPDVKESFGKRLKQERQFWQLVIGDIDRYLGNKKITKVRKARTIKLKPPSDFVKNLKFLKEHPPLKIVSCNPAEIIGAQQLWTYNVKTRKLTQYMCVGPSGLGVKGTTITAFDEQSSVTKTLRKPEVTLPQLLQAGKLALRKFITEINTNPSKPNGRINSDTILLRVIK